MLIAEARVETEQASVYLERLCRHVSKAAQAAPQMPAQVGCSDDQGVINLGSARCVLHAEPGVLTLRVEAPDEESLRDLEERIGSRLEMFGGRDQLKVGWSPPDGSAELSSSPRPHHERPSHG
jgi:hypothetical protein